MTETRKLGSTGLSVAPLVAGGNVFGWNVDEKTSFEILDAFFDGGVTMVDTADIYSSFVPGNVGGESETIIGKWMKARGNRARVQVATKVGFQPINGKRGLATDTINTAVDLSLTRLQTDYIDLYYAHGDDPTAPQEEVADTFDRLVKAGKVRSLGASNFTQDRLASALAISKDKGLARYGAFQPEFNLVKPESFDGSYRQFCQDNEVGGLAYYALASGFLTGKYRSEADGGQSAARDHAVKGFMNDGGFAVLDVMDAVASETGAALAEIALAWIMATPGLTGAIASATRLSQVQPLINAMHLKLSADQMARLNKASAGAVPA